MHDHTTHAHPSLSLASTSLAEPVPTSSPHSIHLSAPVSTRRTPVTDRMVETVMILTILRLEEVLIPAQGAGDVLTVYVQDSEITHNVRRTLEVFNGDIDEAVDNLCAFVIDEVADAPHE